MTDDAKDAFRRTALALHEFPKPGKLEISATKPLANQRDLAPRRGDLSTHNLCCGAK